MASYQRIPYEDLEVGSSIDNIWKYSGVSGLESAAYRFRNETDVEVTVTAGTTDSRDTGSERLQMLDFFETARYMGQPIFRNPSDTGTSSLTVAAGSVESYTIREVWDRVVFMFEPTTSPSSGFIEVIETI